MPTQNLTVHFNEQRARILERIRELVEEETPTDAKARLDRFLERLAGHYRMAGMRAATVRNPSRGNHLRAHFDSAEQVADLEAAPALILCHYDTVWPVGSLETHPFRVDDRGWAYGPGIFDMKSSLALVEFAIAGVRDLNLRLPRPVTVLVTSDEEVGSQTSRQLIEEEARRSAFVLVMEPPLPGGRLKTRRKGGAHFHLKITGRAAHAGVEPEKGISAVQELARQILTLHGLTDLETGTTVNVGVAHAGTRANVVAAEAEAQIDVRTWTADEMDRVTAAIRGLTPALPGVEIEVSGGIGRPPLEKNATEHVFHHAKGIAETVGLTLREGGTGGGSDGNLTGALGIPTLDGLGVPGEGAHADHEHIEVDKIGERAALLTALLMGLAP